MERKTLAVGIGLGMLGVAGVGLGAMMKARRRRRREPAGAAPRASASDRGSRRAPGTFSGDIRGGGPGAGADLGRNATSTPTGDIAGGGEPGSLVDYGAGTVTVRDAVPTGGAGASADPLQQAGPGAALPPPDHNPPRTATRMAPGIPVGSGRGIDAALAQPDTDLGGGVTGDTTVSRADGEKNRDERSIRNDDRGRTTL